MRPTRRLHTAALAAAVSLTGLVGPAEAQEQAWGIVSLSASNVRVDTGACIYVPISASYQNVPGHEHDWSASVQVWRGPQYISEAFVWSQETTTSNSPTLTVDGEYLWCSYEGFGTFRLGPSHVDASDYSGDPSASFEDDTTATFTVKQDAKLSLGANRVTPRRMVKLTSVSRYFNSDRSRWVRWANKSVVFQRATASGWKTIGRDRTNRTGVATVTVASRKTTSFRAVTPGTSRIWKAGSRRLSVPSV